MPDDHRRSREPGDRLYGDCCERPTIKCGNPWDAQTERVFYGDGTWHSLSANSRGGQSRDAVLILESNQNHATVKDTEICPTLPASMGMGGGYVPMIVDTLVFDESQITSPTNGNVPQWGGGLPHAVQRGRTSSSDNKE